MMKNIENIVPDWYWSHGLHDAIILSVSEIPCQANRKIKNCLQFSLDSSHALMTQAIRKISFYNYKILTPEIDINELRQPWWMNDRLIRMPDGRYQLCIDLESTKRKHRHRQFCLEFEFADVE